MSVMWEKERVGWRGLSLTCTPDPSPRPVSSWGKGTVIFPLPTDPGGG